jgi:hypothetical protein
MLSKVQKFAINLLFLAFSTQYLIIFRNYATCMLIKCCHIFYKILLAVSG